MMDPVFSKIAVWGDSLLKGVVLDEAAGRYRILKDNVVSQCAKLLGISIQNRSHFGLTSGKGKELLLSDLDTDQDFSAAILEFGGNDCDYNWAEVAERPDDAHIPNTPLDQFTDNVRVMINSLKAQDVPIVVVSLPPIHSVRYFNWITRTGLSQENILRFLGDVEHIYRHHERYSMAVTRLACEMGCHLIDIRDAFLAEKHYEDYLCLDGIHPNQKGHQLMRDALISQTRHLLPITV